MVTLLFNHIQGKNGGHWTASEFQVSIQNNRYRPLSNIGSEKNLELVLLDNKIIKLQIGKGRNFPCLFV